MTKSYEFMLRFSRILRRFLSFSKLTPEVSLRYTCKSKSVDWGSFRKASNLSRNTGNKKYTLPRLKLLVEKIFNFQINWKRLDLAALDSYSALDLALGLGMATLQIITRYV